MIPISENERLEYVDEKDGVKYFYRALTGQHENKFYEIVAKDSKEKSIDERKAVTRELVDFLLIGWEATGKTPILPASGFPDDGHPSKCFSAVGNNQLVEWGLQVNRLTDVEAKNS